MAIIDTSPRRDTLTPGRSSFLAAVAGLAAVAAMTGCSGIGEAADAASEPADCPAWVEHVLTSTPIESDGDPDEWRAHHADRAATLAAIADRLPASDAAVIDAYAEAVRAFGDEPLAPGASRRMGEAAADATALADRSC